MAKASKKAAPVDISEDEGADLLSTKKATKTKSLAVAKVSKKAAPAKAEKAAPKKERTPRGDSLVPAITAALLKVKKATEYSAIAESTGADIKSVRRTARKMRDAGEISLEKEGTKVYVNKA